MTKRANVLVVEVEESRYDEFAPPLLRAIFEVDRVTDAPSALQLLKMVPFSVIICHYPLRSKETSSFIKELRADGSASKESQLALICDETHLEEGSHFLGHGADLVLSLAEPEGEREVLLCTLLGIQPRRSLRVLVKLSMELQRGGHDRFVAQSRDISASGFFLVTRKVLPLDIRLQFQFSLQGDPRPFQGKARVARVVGKHEGGTQGLGLRFEQFAAHDDPARLKNHLQQITCG